MSCVSTRQMSWLSTRHMSCVSTIRYAWCRASQSPLQGSSRPPRTSPRSTRGSSGPGLGQGANWRVSGEIASSQVTRIVTRSAFLEFIRRSPGVSGDLRGSPRKWSQEPLVGGPLPTRHGQDDGSLTNWEADSPFSWEGAAVCDLPCARRVALFL